MIEQSSLSCPHCGAHMRVVRTPQILVHRCEPCAGSWLEWPDAMRTLMGDVRADGRELIRRIDTRPTGHDPYRDRRPEGRKVDACPACGEGIMRVRTDGPPLRALVTVELELCKDHGVWFDATELVAVAEAAARRREAG